MKTILVPIDFSKSSDNSLEVAIAMAEKNGAKIKVINIIEGIDDIDFSSSGTVSTGNDMNKIFVLKLMEKAKHQIKQKLAKFDVKGLRIEDEVVVGSVFESISNIIAEQDIDLIIMGMRSKEEKEAQKVAGSNTIKVVRKANCPVLIIKNKQENFNIRKLLLATDFETISPEYIAKIKDLKDSFGFELHVLYVNTQISFITTASFEALKNEFIKKYNLEDAFFHTINAYFENEGIITFAEKINADLIALTTHGRKGINLFFFGSVSENVVNESNIPILTFRVE